MPAPLGCGCAGTVEAGLARKGASPPGAFSGVRSWALCFALPRLGPAFKPWLLVGRSWAAVLVLAPNVSWWIGPRSFLFAFVPRFLVGRSWVARACAQCVLARTGARLTSPLSR